MGGIEEDSNAMIGGEGVAPRDMLCDGVPNGEVEEVGDGHRDGEGDDLAELRECRGVLGEHRPATQSSSFSGEKEDGDGERSG